MKKIRLVQDWRKCHKWLSVRCMAIATAILATWSMMPDDLKAGIPHQWVMYIAMAFMGLGIAGRLIDQEPKEEGDVPK
jgi:hypothetical protein